MLDLSASRNRRGEIADAILADKDVSCAAGSLPASSTTRKPCAGKRRRERRSLRKRGRFDLEPYAELRLRIQERRHTNSHGGHQSAALR